MQQRDGHTRDVPDLGKLVGDHRAPASPAHQLVLGVGMAFAGATSALAVASGDGLRASFWGLLVVGNALAWVVGARRPSGTSLTAEGVTVRQGLRVRRMRWEAVTQVRPANRREDLSTLVSATGRREPRPS